MPQNIAVIEDESSIAKGLIYGLEQEGACWAQTGEAGLELVGEKPPHLLILDIRLPGSSGYEVCRTLRSPHVKKY